MAMLFYHCSETLVLGSAEFVCRIKIAVHVLLSGSHSIFRGSLLADLRSIIIVFIYLPA